LGYGVTENKPLISVRPARTNILQHVTSGQAKRRQI